MKLRRTILTYTEYGIISDLCEKDIEFTSSIDFKILGNYKVTIQELAKYRKVKYAKHLGDIMMLPTKYISREFIEDNDLVYNVHKALTDTTCPEDIKPILKDVEERLEKEIIVEIDLDSPYSFPKFISIDDQ